MTATVEPIAASISAAYKAWRVNSGEYTPDEDSDYWGAFWEPLQIDLPETAKPSCCYSNDIIFYDQTGNNRLLKDFVRHYGFSGDDEGSLVFIVSADPETNLVKVDFGKLTDWVAMSPQQAVEIAQSLIKQARSISKEPLRITIN